MVCLGVTAYAGLSADPGSTRARTHDALAGILSTLRRPQGLVSQGGAFEVMETEKWGLVGGCLATEAVSQWELSLF